MDLSGIEAFNALLSRVEELSVELNSEREKRRTAESQCRDFLRQIEAANQRIESQERQLASYRGESFTEPAAKPAKPEKPPRPDRTADGDDIPF